MTESKVDEQPKGFGIACTVAWTELHNAMAADGMSPPNKCGPETRKWIEGVVLDGFAAALAACTPAKSEGM